MAQDEGRFGRINEPKRCWAPAGIRPLAPKQIVRESFYVYAAVAPAIGRMTTLVLPYANTQMMNIFLRQVSEDFADYFIVMQVDQAGWHRSKDLVIPENIRFISQPAYSPELNPAEHIWEEIREKFLQNKAFKFLAEVVNIVCEGLRQLSDDFNRLRSMTWFPHLKINC